MNWWKHSYLISLREKQHFFVQDLLLWHDVMISVDQFVKGRRKYSHRLQSTRSYLDKQLNPAFVPTNRSLFKLRKKRRVEYPLLTTSSDYNQKYVGSLTSNIIDYDPFLKIPTKKLAEAYLGKLMNTGNMGSTVSKVGKLPAIAPANSPHQKKNHRRRTGTEHRGRSDPGKKKPVRRRRKGPPRNPFARHNLSAEQAWLLKRCAC